MHYRHRVFMHRGSGEDPKGYLQEIISKEDTVAELGCGTGFYCQYLKDLAAKVYCVEIDAKAIEEARQNIKAENAVFLNEDAAHTSIPTGSLDAVLLANSFHDMDREAVYQEILRVLKQNGKVIVIDWEKTETAFGPPMWIRMSKGDYLSIFRDFKLEKEFKPSPYHYGLIFKR
ncbi:MAG: class I SAM-dependent methyltransferase [Candidatus Micrarchaeia archaeon]